jgi:hypothetical protein
VRLHRRALGLLGQQHNQHVALVLRHVQVWHLCSISTPARAIRAPGAREEQGRSKGAEGQGASALPITNPPSPHHSAPTIPPPLTQHPHQPSCSHRAQRNAYVSGCGVSGCEVRGWRLGCGIMGWAAYLLCNAHFGKVPRGKEVEAIPHALASV